MQKFYILDDKMNPVECSEIQHLTWIRDHGHVPILATIGFRYQIVADMRRQFDLPPLFEVRLNGAAGTSSLVFRSWKFSKALRHVLSLISDASKSEPQPEPADKPYVIWDDNGTAVPATLDEVFDWIIYCPRVVNNSMEHGDWTTHIDFDVDPARSEKPFHLNVSHSGMTHSRIGFKTFTDAIGAQRKFHSNLRAQ